ncbi:MAG TPA: hypothetical protein VK604_06105, partial [Bryobacteraceae bacterium]|nr:hypothetical protein [Bryobacteraceae bacterium]
YLGKLFYHHAWFTPETTILIYACMIAVALILRQTAMQFRAILLLVTPLPVVFISIRSGSVLYLPMAGLAIYIAALITRRRRQFVRRPALVMRFAVFLLCASLLIKVHSSGLSHVDIAAIGSWFVKSRCPKLQPYFQSGFPYDHDQWISMAGTAWATITLTLAAEPAALAKR